MRAWPVLAGLAAAACSPTVTIDPPKEPIRIQLDVKITQEVKVEVSRDLDQVFDKNPNLFPTGSKESP